METISLIALILLSLVGYSAGAIAKAGKFAELKPQIVDLILISAIWAGAIYSRLTFSLNKWLLIVIWLIIGIMIGIISVWPRNLVENKSKRASEPKITSKNILYNLWQNWKEFSKRMGSFQSRLMLSMFFFIVVSPFAIAVKLFSDPLNIKYRRAESYWLSKKENKADIEQFRRQF